jgi:hypothetical protein
MSKGMGFFLCVAIWSVGYVPGLAESDWKTPTTIRAVFQEEWQGGSNLVTILSQANRLRIHTTLGVGDDLQGVPRVEVISPKGIFTWLEGKPQVTLQLFEPSAMGYLEFLARPRFSRYDLEFNMKGIEQALGKRVVPEKAETVAGRDCLVLTIPDRPDSTTIDFQKLWIDRETGITLKLQDYQKGERVYQREAVEIDYRASATEADFEPAPNALILKGLISPQTLLRMPEGRPLNEVKTDISTINEKTKHISPNWANPLTPQNFVYAQTLFLQGQAITGTVTGGTRQGRNPNRPNNPRNRLAEPQILYIQSNSAGGPTQVEVRVERGPGGRQLIIASGTNPPASGGAGGTTGTPGGASSTATPVLFAKSDFVDPKTGATLSFVQAYSTSALSAFPFLPIGAPEPLNDSRLSEARVYRITQPYDIVILVWRRDKVEYALASSSLTVEQLRQIAQSLMSPSRG